MSNTTAKKEINIENSPVQRHKRKMWNLTDKLRPKIGRMLKMLDDKGNMTEKGASVARDIIQRILKESSPEEVSSLAAFMVEAHNSDYTYKYHHAELIQRWGHASYFAPYIVSNGRKYELLSEDSRVYRRFSKVVNGVKKQQKGKDRLIGLSGIAKADDGDHYIAMVTGGNNGSSDWSSYLDTIRKIVDAHRHAWIVKLHQHSDVYYVLIGFEAK